MTFWKGIQQYTEGHIAAQGQTLITLAKWQTGWVLDSSPNAGFQPLLNDRKSVDRISLQGVSSGELLAKCVFLYTRWAEVLWARRIFYCVRESKQEGTKVVFIREVCVCACAFSVIACNEVNVNWLPVSLSSSHLKSSIAVDAKSHNTYRLPYIAALICFQIPSDVLYLKEQAGVVRYNVRVVDCGDKAIPAVSGALRRSWSCDGSMRKHRERRRKKLVFVEGRAWLDTKLKVIGRHHS